MKPQVKLIRNALLGVLASAGVFVTYETSALSANDPAEPAQGQARHHWGDHHGPMGPEGDAFGMGMAGGFGPALRQLDLTDEQKKSVHDIFAAAHPQMKKIREDMRSLMQTFQNTLPDDPQYASVVARVSNESQELAASVVREASELKTRVYAVLTPEQKAKLPEAMKTASSERGKHHRPPAETNN